MSLPEKEAIDEIVSPEDVPVVSGDHEKKLVKKLLWKLDLHVVPILMLLFLAAFLDRVNIGNARLQGLERDLKMTGHDYNIALFVFFIPYILLEVPSNLILRKLSPSTWLSGIMFAWGIITICQGVTHSFAGLVVCRFLLGVFEAGFVTGCFYLISMYYRRHELQLRINVFFIASILAGAFSGLLAYAIAHLDGTAGYKGWRWIFIIEGLATTVIAIFSKLVIVDWPETANFLNEDEHALLLRRLAEETGPARMDRLDKNAVKRVFSDVKIYLCTGMYFGVVNTGYAGAFFTPTILRQLGWTALRAQVMSIPIFVTAAVVTLIVAILSDRWRHRFGFAMLGCVVATMGFLILIFQHNVPVGARYFALYAVVIGGYITQPVLLTWLGNNTAGHYKRGIASAIQIGGGNCGGLVASNIFLTSEAPRYPTGYWTSLSLIWFTAICCVLFFLYIRRENRLRAEGKRDHRLSLEQRELLNLGDDHPYFRFAY